MRTRWMLALFPLLTAGAAYGCGSDDDDDGAGGSGASGSPGSSSSGSGGSGAQGGDASSSSGGAGEGGAGTGGSGGASVGGSGGAGGAGEGGAGGGGSASACTDCIDAESLDCECPPDSPSCGDWADCTEDCLKNDFTQACVDACEAMYPGGGEAIIACVCIPACAAACGPICP